MSEKFINRSQRSVALDINEGHSVKPDTLQERLSLMFPGATKIEFWGEENYKGGK